MWGKSDGNQHHELFKQRQAQIGNCGLQGAVEFSDDGRKPVSALMKLENILGIRPMPGYPLFLILQSLNVSKAHTANIQSETLPNKHNS